MPNVGHEGNNSRGVRYASVGLQFLIAVLLAFIGFTLQGLGKDTAAALAGVQEAQVSISRMESKLDGINARLDRLERAQDRPDR